MDKRTEAIQATIYANEEYDERCRELYFAKEHKNLFTGYPRYKYTEGGYKKLILELETAKEKAHLKVIQCVRLEVVERLK
jgi:hypothetical protein